MSRICICERIDASGKTAEFRGAQEPIRIIPETIAVKGAAPIHLDVRVTRHGPLVSDAHQCHQRGREDGSEAADISNRSPFGGPRWTMRIRPSSPFSS